MRASFSGRKSRISGFIQNNHTPATVVEMWKKLWNLSLCIFTKKMKVLQIWKWLSDSDQAVY